MKRACITGITGQDGSYLAELLLEQGYEVHGIVRRVALDDPEHRMSRINHLLGRVQLHPASLESYASLQACLLAVKPNELYHLAAQSFVAYSFEDAFSTFRTNVDGTHYVLEAARQCAPECKVYFAATSEMFGRVAEVPQSETTPFHPRSPYGISKLTGFELARNYREAYGMFVCSGILFNHESPRRGFEFVTRKITSHVARIKKGMADHVVLGNLEARRDWGFAKDYVGAMHLMLQNGSPQDYVIATGEMHSVREFCEVAFAHVGLDYSKYVTVSADCCRPAEVDLLVGDSTRAKNILGWSAQCSFARLVGMMVDHDLNVLVGR